MRKEIRFGNNKISYLIKKSNRAKRVRLTVYQNQDVVLTVPSGVLNSVAEKFLRDKFHWLLRKVNIINQRKKANFSVSNDREKYLKNKKQAQELIKNRLNYFSKKYNFKFNRVSVRNQKTRWGSCSEKGNLNFNYRLIYLTEEQVDYIVVHELCHLKQLNHSKKFWKLVEKIIPNYKDIRKEIKNIKF